MKNQKSETNVPPDLELALSANPKSGLAWKSLTPISRRDFISWINEAKQEETRKRRITRCIENLEKGKKRPCCYAVITMDFYKAMGAIPEAKTFWSSLTANEKRDYSDWIEESENKDIRKERIKKACASLASGLRKLR